MAISHRIIPPLKPQDLARFWPKVDVRGPDECWLWTASKNHGYGEFGVGSRLFLAHRVTWTITNGPIPPGMNVLHDCDNPPCQNPRHLFLGTDADNVADMMRKGRQVPGISRGERHGSHTHPERVARGERNGMAKLTEQDVRDIRKRYAAGGIAMAALGQEYGVSAGMIWLIIHHKKWAHVV